MFPHSKCYSKTLSSSGDVSDIQKCLLGSVALRKIKIPAWEGWPSRLLRLCFTRCETAFSSVLDLHDYSPRPLSSPTGKEKQ